MYKVNKYCAESLFFKSVIFLSKAESCASEIYLFDWTDIESNCQSLKLLSFFFSPPL